MNGVIVNVITVIVGTAIGLLFGKASRSGSGPSRSLNRTGNVDHRRVHEHRRAQGDGQTEMGGYAFLVFVGALLVGSLTGEALRIEYWLERFGLVLQDLSYRLPWLAPVPKDAKDEPGEKGHTLVEGFVTASLLFCVGAMTVLGSIQSGLGDPSILYLKAMLDGFAALFLAATLGVGVGFSVIPVLVIQGSIALGAQALEAVLTPAVISSISAVGGALILSIGMDLLGIKRLPVGNMLPAVIIAAVVGGILG